MARNMLKIDFYLTLAHHYPWIIQRMKSMFTVQWVGKE